MAPSVRGTVRPGIWHRPGIVQALRRETGHQNKARHGTPPCGLSYHDNAIPPLKSKPTRFVMTNSAPRPIFRIQTQEADRPKITSGRRRAGKCAFDCDPNWGGQDAGKGPEGVSRGHHILNGVALAQTEWVDHPVNPVIEAEDVGPWSPGELWANAVVYDGTKYHLWFTSREENGYLGSTGIGHATSPDGSTLRGAAVRWFRVWRHVHLGRNCTIVHRRRSIGPNPIAAGRNRFSRFSSQFRHDSVSL